MTDRETFVQNYDEHFFKQYSFWRSYQDKFIYRHIDFGDPHNGFVHVKSKDGGHEYLLVFSFKCQHFFTSCQKGSQYLGVAINCFHRQ